MHNVIIWVFTRWAGTVYPSGAPEFTSVLSGVRVIGSLVLCVMFVDHQNGNLQTLHIKLKNPRNNVLFLLSILFSVLRLRIQSTPLVSSNSSFDYERTWWRLFKVVRTTFDIYVFIIFVFVILNKWFYRFIFICMFYTRNITNTVKVGGKINSIVLTG